ncbi:glycosyl hydrolase family 67 [Leeuwenhoekiella aestuarii]|uniref:Glycosyl hydrolase family 67 n=1 Tax=Leeuwenhoekiella aestuarii TaxID=2249426 RepID=A0A4Q0NPA8_9FLAO|nr:glycosyl hydrolase 115 family protein [Leeuwenhoekiella aestuarii]RXG12017.1 glycosyl hydrolase family 67 [Leeuwenhoekiella aestuarii]RXG13575.1 glycosyl hydrolase family 67 [Leeuwenhoekiella aestuarii]
MFIQSISIKSSLFFFAIVLICCNIDLVAQNISVSQTTEAGAFKLVDGTSAAQLVIDTEDYEGVHIAVKNLQKDIERVSSQKPKFSKTIDGSGAVIIGTLGKSKYLDNLIASGKLNLDSIKNKWEAFTIQQVDGNLVIAGSDKRGTIYGVYTLSEKIGVSPWYWWADVPVKKSKVLYITSKSFTDLGPKVQYRGIFINDEAPALSGWVGENFGSFNHEFYEHVFELILRLKGNYLWPAMWGRAFYDDDPQNPIEADKYGVVIGTSHHEPLMRAHAEWDKYGAGNWNYTTNSENLRDFWKKGIERMGTNESIVTVGMRGDGDEPMTEVTAIELLEGIVKDQRKIIEAVTQKPANETPQIWALYKEVQDYYDQGMRVPDDVTLLLADDNWGNIRKLPHPEEGERAGGYGIYYHFDYVGGPRNYKWLNTNQISRVYEQMSLAYAYNARKIWIVNVGDIKPMEYPTSFFLDYAWNPENFNLKDLANYPREWAAAQFGDTYASEIGELLQTYSTLASRRKPELLSPETFSHTYSNEAETILKEYKDLEQKTLKIKDKLNAAYQSAYYQLVLFPIEALANINRLYIATAKNRLYAKQGRNTTNQYADQVQELFENDKALTEAYHSLNDSKWNHFMDQTHIGYTYWQEPRQNTIPETETIKIPQTGKLGIATSGTTDFYPNVNTLEVLPFDQSHTVQQITLFNTGVDELDFKLNKLPKWLSANLKKGSFSEEQVIELKLNPKKLPQEPISTSFSIKSADHETQINVRYQPYFEEAKGFLAYNGMIAIPANGYVKNTGWELLPDLGRQDVALRPKKRFSKEITTTNTCLEYEFYTPQQLKGTLSFYLSPTLDFKNQGGLSFKYQIDEGEVLELNMHQDTSDNWGASVSNNTTHVKKAIKIAPGNHTLKIFGKDPGVVIQQIEIKSQNSHRDTYLVAPSKKVATD